MKKMSVAALLGLGVLLAGCNLKATFPIYTMDVRDIIDAKKAVEISYDLLSPIPSADKCDEYTKKALPILKSSFGKIESRGCEKDGFRDFLRLRASTHIYPMPPRVKNLSQLIKTQQENKEPIALHLSSGGKGPSCILIALAPNLVDGLMKKLEEMFFQKPDGISFILVINNDMRSTVKLAVRDVFVDGKPIVYTKKIDIKRRDKVIVRPSNVQEEYLRRNAFLNTVCFVGLEEGNNK